MSDEVIHLFRPGSNITLCCRMHALDQRLKIGTYDEGSATCTGVLEPTVSDHPDGNSDG